MNAKAAQQPQERAIQLDIFSPLQVALEVYDGPLEVLLELIRKKKMDIQTVPLAQICIPYLQYLEQMPPNLEEAGEFLGLATQLILIKSRSLLPPDESEAEDEEDPEVVLRVRLENYQKFKRLSEEMADIDRLWREVFPRPTIFEDDDGGSEQAAEPTPVPLSANISVYNLVQAYQNARQRRALPPKPSVYQVAQERSQLEVGILEVMHLLAEQEQISYFSLCSSGCRTGEDQRQTALPLWVLYFLVFLEVAKMRCARLQQAGEFGDIHGIATDDILERLCTYQESPKLLQQALQR